MRSIILWCHLCALVAVLCFATTLPTDAGAGRTAAQFLGLGGGAKASGMGEAYTAMNGNVTSAFWNPAGLANIQEIQGVSSYNNAGARFGEAGEGIYYRFLAGALPLGNGGNKNSLDLGTIGATLQLNGQGSIAVTEDSPSVVRQLDLGTNWALTGLYANRLSSRLLLGVSGKVIRQVLASVSATAYAVDLGTQYHLLNFSSSQTEGWDKFPDQRITLAAALQNLGTRIQFKDANQSVPLPRTMRMGALWSIRIASQDFLSDKTIFPSYWNILRMNLTADLVAFVDKLKEDDEEGLQQAVEDRLLLEQNQGKTEEEIRNELEAERGVGIHAFRWRNLQKSVGVESWLLDMLALRLGYKDDPYIPNAEFKDRLYVGAGVRLPIGVLLQSLSGDSLEGEDRLFLQGDVAIIPGGGPENKRLWTVDLSGGF